MDRAGGPIDRSRMSYGQQVYPGPAAGGTMGTGYGAAIGGRGEAFSSGQVLSYGDAEEDDEEEEEEQKDYKDPSSSWRRHSHGVPLTSSLSFSAPAPHEAILDPTMYRPFPADDAASSSVYSASERTLNPRAPASTASSPKRERKSKKAPSYMPLWRCDTCNDEISVFLRDEHCNTKAHLRLARRATAGGGGESSVASGSGGSGGGGGSVYDEAPESSTGYVGLLPAFKPVPGYKLRDTFYCPPCGSEFPLSVEVLHDVESGMYMCVCCARRVHTAGRAVHAMGDVHQQMARVQLAGDHEGERYEEEDVKVGWNAVEGVEAEEEEKEVREIHKSEDMASKGEQKARVEHEGGERDGTPVWECNVCKEPLLGEELTNHRAWHCRGAASSGAAAAGNQAQILSLPPQKPRRAPQLPARPPTPIVPYETFFCEPCNKHVGVMIRDIHITSLRHIRATKASSCARDQAPHLHPQPLLPQTSIPLPPPPRPAPHPAPPTPAPPEKAYCPECHKWKQASTMAAHRRSNKHMKKAAAARGEPPAPRAKPRPAPPPTPKVYCPECRKWKRASEIASHRTSKKHKKKAAELAEANMAGRAWTGEVPTAGY